MRDRVVVREGHSRSDRDGQYVRDEELAAERAKFEESKVGIEKRFESGDHRLVELRLVRDEIMPALGKEAVDLYTEAVKRYPDSAVVEAKNGTCTGCRMVLPPQEFANVRKGEQIINCINCRRIMFFAVQEDQPAETPEELKPEGKKTGKKKA